MSEQLDGRERKSSPGKNVTLERVYRASLKDVWDLWTTKDGIESWWGPGGFAVTVRHLDLRPGGELRYAMTAVDPEQVAFMRSEGMPVTTEARITYTEIVPRQRLAYEHAADFIPGVEPYLVAHLVELQQLAKGQVRMTLTIGVMHNEEWTERAVAGWESELVKLEALLRSRTESSHA
jgi:uncharacterized protein YndB with AHSA1/START domain